MADTMPMMLGSDDEEYDDDVQDFVNSRDWNSSSENEVDDEGETPVPEEGKVPQPHFTMGDVSASWNIPSAEEKRKHFGLMFSTEQKLGAKVEIPANGEAGAGDSVRLQNSGHEAEISDGIGQELEFCQEENATGKADERRGELVFSDDEDSDFGGMDFVFPAPDAAKQKFNLDDLVNGVISSPLDHSTPIVKATADQPITQAETNEVIVPAAADESFREESKNLSFLDELLFSPMENVEETAEEEEEPESTSDEAVETPAYENIGVDPEANIWQYKPKGYGHDFRLATGIYQPKTKVSRTHQFMSCVQVDYLERLHMRETCADILELTKPPQPVFHVNEVFQPLAGYWSVTKPSSALESFTTHDIQKFICAALNSRFKLELVIGVDEDGKAVGCVLDRCKRDVIQQAIEFALNNDIQPPISASAVDFQLKQVGPYELEKYIVQITVNEIVPKLYCPVNGLYFFKDVDDVRHVSTLEEAQHFLDDKQGYKPVKLWRILTEGGHECLSPLDPHENRHRFFVPSALAAVFIFGFVARRSLARFL